MVERQIYEGEFKVVDEETDSIIESKPFKIALTYDTNSEGDVKLIETALLEGVITIFIKPKLKQLNLRCNFLFWFKSSSTFLS